MWLGPLSVPKRAPVFVNLDEDLILTYKVGPQGKTNPATMDSLIKLLARR